MKKSRKKRRVFTFQVDTVFPTRDPIAIDLLRLMSAHNDLAFVGEWMTSCERVPVKSAAKTVAASRWFFLQRLFAAIMVEVLKVLDQVRARPDFSKIEAGLDDDGKAALKTLLGVPMDTKHPIYQVLHRTRNKAAFHLDHGQFRSSLRAMLGRYGFDAESMIVYEPKPGQTERGRVYYSLAEQLTTEISFGLPAPGAAPLQHDAFHAAIELHAALTTFIESAFAAYSRGRGLGKFLRESKTDA